MKKIYFKTFGCRTNIFDTQVMIESLGEHASVKSEEEADVIVVNSCTVTNGADTGVRQYVSKINNKYPHIKILFTGCGVETEGKKLFESGKIDSVFGHSEKSRVSFFVNSSEKLYVEGDKESLDDTIITNFEGKTKAFIKIQEGCDFACSYCIIPTVRGKSRSVAARGVLRQIEKLCDAGFSEFVLTGTNVGSYGLDEGGIETLLKGITTLGGVKRLRLGSIEPSQITEGFLQILSEPIFARHLHIAIQHSSNKMLEKMNRVNRFEKDLALFERLSSLGFAIGTDFIVGFPGESEEIWGEATTNLAAMPLTHIHPFIYSKRDFTEAAKLKQDVHPQIAKERLSIASEIVAAKNRAFREKIKEPLTVHVEDSKMAGFDQYFNKITFEKPQDAEWVTVKEFEVFDDNTVARR